jgi:hypothetical protein
METNINIKTEPLGFYEKEFIGNTAASILRKMDPSLNVRVEFTITSRVAYQAIMDACECLPTLARQNVALAQVASDIDTLQTVSRSAIRFISNI